ncbi:MAG: outer membrane protein assembly factor BamE [Paracoccaceae bacterium]
MRNLSVALGVALAVSACSPIVRHHGYVPEAGEIAALTPGVDTAETVIAALGPPVARGAVGEDALFYVRSRFSTLGPLRPREVDRQVVAVSFAPGGALRNVERFGLEEGRVVRLSRRVTDDGLRDTVFLRQLLGNIGNFNAGDIIDGPGGGVR